MKSKKFSKIIFSHQILFLQHKHSLNNDMENQKNKTKHQMDQKWSTEPVAVNDADCDNLCTYTNLIFNIK